MLAFAYDSRTKGNVATEIVKYFLQIHYRDQEGPPQLRPAQARQLLPGELSAVGTLRLEPTRVQAWAVRSAGAIWKAFDAQLRHLRAAAGHHRAAHGLHELRLHAADAPAPRSRAG